jgi:hypothetical protein
VDRDRSRLWMRRVPISVGPWILREPNLDWAWAIGPWRVSLADLEVDLGLGLGCE